MLIADAHCDTLTRAMDLNENIYKNTGHVDLDRMQMRGRHIQFFAVFIAPDKYKGAEVFRFLQTLDFLYRQQEEFKDFISICTNYEDIQQALNKNKSAAIISIENGGALQGDIAALRMFYKLGVRCIGLTWNNVNEIANGLDGSNTGRGLTTFGREVVAEMNRLGVLVDVSHLSEKSFWDVIETAKAPLIASHSNAKVLCKHPRNLTDEQIKAIKVNLGFIGINLYPTFLNDSNTATIDDIISHIEYIAALTGEDHIGLGADLDGVDCLPEGINGIQHIDKILDRLAVLNYSNEFIEKFASGNLLRIIKQVLK